MSLLLCCWTLITKAENLERIRSFHIVLNKIILCHCRVQKKLVKENDKTEYES